MIIDAHMHMWERRSLPDEAVRKYMEPVLKFKELYDGVFDFNLDDAVPFSDYDVPIDEPIASLDANNIDYGIVLITDFGLLGTAMGIEDYTDWVFTRCQVDDRFLPFIGIDPNRRDACEMMERFVKRYDPKGLKMYPATGFYPDDPKYDRFWDTAEEFGLTVVTHAGMALPPLDEKYCHPSNMRRVAENHPDTTFIIAHMGGKFHDELYPLMEACDNVCTDCSALQGWWPEDAEMVHSRLGEAMSRFPDRVVFGTDFPLYDERFCTRMFIYLIKKGSWCTDSLLEKLLGGNMARILGL